MREQKQLPNYAKEIGDACADDYMAKEGDPKTNTVTLDIENLRHLLGNMTGVDITYLACFRNRGGSR